MVLNWLLLCPLATSACLVYRQPPSEPHLIHVPPLPSYPLSLKVEFSPLSLISSPRYLNFSIFTHVFCVPSLSCLLILPCYTFGTPLSQPIRQTQIRSGTLSLGATSSLLTPPDLSAARRKLSGEAVSGLRLGEIHLILLHKTLLFFHRVVHLGARALN